MAGPAQRAAQISSQCFRLEESHESVCHPVRGSVYTGQDLTRAMELLNRLAHKITDTPVKEPAPSVHSSGLLQSRAVKPLLAPWARVVLAPSCAMCLHQCPAPLQTSAGSVPPSHAVS